MNAGTIQDQVWRAIQIHHVVVIVLSKDSVKSDWVESEVERAMERERREKKDILFPVRIDDSVFDSTAAWAADIRQRHIGERVMDGLQDLEPDTRMAVQFRRLLGVDAVRSIDYLAFDRQFAYIVQITGHCRSLD